jgi:L-lactate dehydrogenase complex protein LldF
MQNFIQKRKQIFSDDAETEQLRELGNSIKKRALSKLPQLLEQLESKCIQNGIEVHWAETTSEANHIVLDIMKSHNATRMVKGKSMVSEEMHLNKFLQKNGIEAMETDLGEFIIQLNDETPSHIIVPAIHKNKFIKTRIRYLKSSMKKSPAHPIPKMSKNSTPSHARLCAKSFMRRRSASAASTWP